MSQYHTFDPKEKLIGGQPAWYYELTREAKEAEVRHRAGVNGNTFVRNASYDGLDARGEVIDLYRSQGTRAGTGLHPKRGVTPRLTLRAASVKVWVTGGFDVVKVKMVVPKYAD